MYKSNRISVCQVNTIPGDFEKNVEKICKSIELAEKTQADILIFPSRTITGTIDDTLFSRKAFIKESRSSLMKLIKISSKTNLKLIITCPMNLYDKKETPLLIDGSNLIDLSEANHKPVFINGQRLTVLNELEENKLVLDKQKREKGHLIVNLNEQPFYSQIQEHREKLATCISEITNSYVLEVNRVGTTDDMVYYGGSFLKNPQGNTLIRAKAFEEDQIGFDIQYCAFDDFIDCLESKKTERPMKKNNPETRIQALPSDIESIHLSIVQSIRDYITKNGFKTVLIGLSGGLDSALVAALSAEALGADSVFGLMMPSQFSSKGSEDDSVKLASNLGIKTARVPIQNVYSSIDKELGSFFGERVFSTTDENIQARIRALYLMAASNEYGWFVLNTGNNSETATGYSTLYGDTIGGYAPISDLYKSDCYKLANFINDKKGYAHIPREIIEKAPSAELSPGQTDQDSLPSYDILDGILKSILEENLSFDEIIDKGYERQAVAKSFRLLRISEYKRRQEPLGPRLSKSSFKYDMHLPITTAFKEEKL